MKSKTSIVLLALIATFLAYLMIYSMTGCTPPEEALPTCDFVKASFDGEEVKIKIHSASKYVEICRDFTDRRQCMKLDRDYFNCISISVDYGETITFIDKEYECQIVVR